MPKFLLRQDTLCTLILHRSNTVSFNVQRCCLELHKIVHLVISFAQFIPTSPSFCRAEFTAHGNKLDKDSMYKTNAYPTTLDVDEV